MIQWIK